MAYIAQGNDSYRWCIECHFLMSKWHSTWCVVLMRIMQVIDLHRSINAIRYWINTGSRMQGRIIVFNLDMQESRTGNPVSLLVCKDTVCCSCKYFVSSCTSQYIYLFFYLRALYQRHNCHRTACYRTLKIKQNWVSGLYQANLYYNNFVDVQLKKLFQRSLSTACLTLGSSVRSLVLGQMTKKREMCLWDLANQVPSGWSGRR